MAYRLTKHKGKCPIYTLQKVCEQQGIHFTQTRQVDFTLFTGHEGP